MFIYERDGKMVVSWYGTTLGEIQRVAQEYFPSVPPRIRVTAEIDNGGKDQKSHIVLSEV